MFLEMNLIFLIMYYTVICTVNTVLTEFLGAGIEGWGYDLFFFVCFWRHEETWVML